ncbi:MAG TPA: metal-sensing transcriptional repressor [Candidatus Pullilachnospira intestinigallinarum]|nr:metal-sensing transcriptional repressor [Candidatus Pullilachnospira intestinigallinarum]
MEKEKKSCGCLPECETGSDRNACLDAKICPERAGCPEWTEGARGAGCEKKVCCHKKKQRSEKEYKELINRLNRIEGQVRGIRRMVENDVYCTDILVQVSAVNAALNSFNKVLLANHIRSCVADDIRAGKDETIDELVVTLQKLMK